MKRAKFFHILFSSYICLMMLGTPALSQNEFWKPLTRLPGLYPASIMITPVGSIFVATDSGLFRSTDEGESWQTISGGLPSNQFYHQSDVISMTFWGRQLIFAGTRTNGVYCSSDEGQSWRNVGFMDSCVWAIVCNNLGYLFAAIEPFSMWRSIDNGENWTRIDTSQAFYPPVYHLFLTPQNILFVEGIDAGSGDGQGILFRSEDNGESWTHLKFPYLYATCMAYKSDGTIFMTAIQPVLPPMEDISGIYRTINLGDNWIKLNDNFERSEANAITINSSGHIYAGGMLSGVHRSLDNGETWEIINSGLSNLSIKILAFSTEDYLFAGTSGGGLFRSQQKTTSVDHASISDASTDTLELIYPNPTNFCATISFKIACAGWVNLKLYNAIGQEIMSLGNNYYPAGSHLLNFQTGQLPSGIYWLIMQTARSKVAKKMITIN